ncbi:MAG: phosphodiester glycosidase family protein [Candidatus Dormibacteraeota bacterium]|nr:phosphodiester glycosidase family protein [Candidatus Dormibacteraeota bacterium]
MSASVRRAASALTAAVFALTAVPAAAHTALPLGTSNAGDAALPLGPASLQESRTTQVLSPGVTLTTVLRGYASSSDYWTINAGFFAARATADALAARLGAAGHPAAVQEIEGRAVDDPTRGPAGDIVTTGHFATEPQATATSQQLTAAGFTGLSVTNTSLMGGETTGPWVVRILRVDSPELPEVTSHLATDVIPGKETVSSMAGRLGAVGAVNGGYFVVGTSDGVPGDLAGVAVENGHLVSEAVDHRAALVLGQSGQHRASVGSLTTELIVRSSDGAGRSLNGIDRSVGVIRDCGEPGDQPTTMPQQDITCTNPNEIVVFDGAFGTTAPTGTGVTAVLDEHGRVSQLTETRGGTIPAGGELLEGVGTGADWLRTNARLGMHLKIAERVTADQRPLPLRPDTYVVNGGPFLVRDGQPYVDAYTEGFVHPADPGFYYAFAIARNPRTMAGLTGDGDLLLVTVDGRAPGYSVGMSFSEESAVMHTLGAVGAINLDGGGSTTMVVNGQLLGRPSDTTGERPVGDAILVIPDPRRPHY